MSTSESPAAQQLWGPLTAAVIPPKSSREFVVDLVIGGPHACRIEVLADLDSELYNEVLFKTQSGERHYDGISSRESKFAYGYSSRIYAGGSLRSATISVTNKSSKHAAVAIAVETDS